MKSKLIFIGGAPGVGKTIVTRYLFKELDNAVWLDGDDVWRMNPFIVNTETKTMVEKNIKFVLNSFIQARFPYVLFTWVLHTDSIINGLLEGLNRSGYDFHNFTLKCDENTLKKRISNDTGRTTELLLALERLKQTETVNSTKIDTADKKPFETAIFLKESILNSSS